MHDQGIFGDLAVVMSLTMGIAVSEFLDKVDNYFLSYKFCNLLYIQTMTYSDVKVSQCGDAPLFLISFPLP